jgi:IS5 family transposase
MDHCHLKGEVGDRLHAVLSAASYDIHLLLGMFARMGTGIAILRSTLSCLLPPLPWGGLG